MQRWLLWASISLGFLELELRASFWCYPSNTISSLLSCAWSPIGPPAVTNARMLEWATLTIQREPQAGHGPAFCRNISFSYSHNPHLPPRVDSKLSCSTRWSKNMSLRKRDFGLHPHPGTGFREAGSGTNVFPEQRVCDSRSKASPAEEAAWKLSSSAWALGGKPIIRIKPRKLSLSHRWAYVIPYVWVTRCASLAPYHSFGLKCLGP